MSQTTGLFQNLVPSGSAPPAQGVGGGLDVGQLKEVRNMIWKSVLPAGRLKTALLATDGSIIDAFKTMLSLVQGRKYREGHYKLGERLIDQIKCGSVGWKDIPDDVVPLARQVFSILFGVRILTGEDLDALDEGPSAYYGRGDKSDIPAAAVNRAVMLKQNFFPISTYNNTCWDLSVFERYPLVAPIPAMNLGDDDAQNVGRKYTGPGFNDQQFVNGLLTYNSPSSNLTSGIRANEQGNPMQQGMGSITPETLKKYSLIIAILLIVGVIISVRAGLYKPS